MSSKSISQLHWKPGDFHFWSSPVNANVLFFQFSTFSVKDNFQVRFREDTWPRPTPLLVQYLSCIGLLYINFHNSAGLGLSQSWYFLFVRIYWGVASRRRMNTKNDKFSVKSLYEAIIHNDAPLDKKWKLKITLRMKIFLWFFIEVWSW